MSNFLTISLGAASGGGGGGAGARLPRIGYDNKGVGATVTATSTATGYDPTQLFDWKPFTLWTPATSGVHHVTVIPATVSTVNYFAIAQHNLGTNGGSIKLQYSLNSGGSWNDATTLITPVSDETIWQSFSDISASHWRLEVTSTPASVIGVVSFGAAYLPYYGMLEGFSPTKLARDVEIYAHQSEEGLSLGRSILRRNTKNSITFNNMHISDVYNYWLPFIKHAEKKPFFFVWLYEDYPADVGLVETMEKIQPPKFSSHEYFTCQLDMIGLLPS
jgi:hypothetical protein